MPLNYTVPALHRAIRVLEILSSAPQGLSLAQLSKETKVPKSTMFRILFTLHENAVVIEDPERKTFTLGMKLLDWGNAALAKVDLKNIAHSHLVKLAQETRESFYLAILDHDDVILIDHVDTPEVWKMVTRLGHRSPVHCTATGLVLIADLNQQELDNVLARRGLQKYTSKTVTSKLKLKKRLEDVRAQGYAIVDGEYKPDLFAIAVPIQDHTGKVTASLMTAIPSGRATRDKGIIDELISVLKGEAAVISSRVGYNGG